MPLIARATNTVRNKNLIIVLMCVAALAMFAYDGWQGYPARNDEIVTKKLANAPTVLSADQELIRDWKGWVRESTENRQRMDGVIEYAKTTVRELEKWKTSGEIALQRWIALALLFINAAAMWWFVHCQRRRAIADDATLSPAPGVVIPWEKITRIDNTRWDAMGIVELTYTDASGTAKKAKLDDYETQRKPLLEILDLLAVKAVNAEVFPKDEPKEKSEGDAAAK